MADAGPLRKLMQPSREAFMKRLFLLVALLVIAMPARGEASTVGLEDITWPEVRDAIAAGKLTAIIYVGSSEQNGPHMVI